MKKILAIILTISIVFCFAACGNKDTEKKEDIEVTVEDIKNSQDIVEDESSQDVEDPANNKVNDDKFRKEFLTLAENNTTKIKDALPQKWNGEVVFKLNDATINLPMKVQDFLDITGYDYAIIGPNADGTGDWSGKKIKSNQIDSYFNLYKITKFDDKGNPAKLSMLEIHVYNPYSEDTLVSDCYVVGFMSKLSVHSSKPDPERLDFSDVILPGNIKTGDPCTVESLGSIFGKNAKDTATVAFYAYNEDTGNYMINIEDGKMESFECFYRLPIAEQGITYSEKYPPRLFEKAF
jgi:hypothetical protein